MFKFKVPRYWIFVLCLPYIESASIFPPSVRVCPRNSPDLAKCVTQSIDILRPYLKNGDLGNGFLIEPLEPIKIDDINIQRGSGFIVNIKNLQAHGASNFKIEKLRINVENFKVDVVVSIPKVTIYGNYKLKMLLGVLNINGEGKSSGVLDNLKLKFSFSGSKYIKNGEEYIKADNSNVSMKFAKITMNFENLFKNDKSLNDLGNQLINQNIAGFMVDIEPVITKSLAKKILKSANSIMQRAPFNVFLP